MSCLTCCYQSLFMVCAFVSPCVCVTAVFSDGGDPKTTSHKVHQSQINQSPPSYVTSSAFQVGSRPGLIPRGLNTDRRCTKRWKYFIPSGHKYAGSIAARTQTKLLPDFISVLQAGLDGGVASFHALPCLNAVWPRVTATPQLLRVHSSAPSHLRVEDLFVSSALWNSQPNVAEARECKNWWASFFFF